MAQQANNDSEIVAIMERARQRRIAAQVAGFVQSFKALVRKLPKPPAPRKSGRKGDDEKGRASYRKNINRLFTKVTRWTVDDERGDHPPTVDNDWWHWHRQSMAGARDHRQEQERPLQSQRPNYLSSTL